MVEGIDLTGQTCVITGASSGLGRESAKALAATGAMAIAVLLLQSTVARDLPPFARLVAAAFTGAVVFSAVAWLALGRKPPQGLRGPEPVAAE